MYVYHIKNIYILKKGLSLSVQSLDHMDNKALMQEKESEYQCKVLSKNFKLMLTNQNDTTMKKKMSVFGSYRL